MSNEIALNFRDSEKVRDALDAYAARQDLRRSEVLRVLVREALAARGMWPAVTASGDGQAMGGTGARENGTAG